MRFLGFGLSKEDKERFDNFQKHRRPSMRVVGRGTLTMSLEDAHKARLEKSNQVDTDYPNTGDIRLDGKSTNPLLGFIFITLLLLGFGYLICGVING